MKTRFIHPRVASCGSFLLLLLITLGAGAPVSRAQMQPRALLDGERLPVTEMDSRGYWVEKDGHRMGPGYTQVDFVPHKTFGKGFVTVKDEWAGDSLQHGKAAGGKHRFHYQAELTSDIDMKDCYAALFFVSNSSIGSHWIPVGRLSAGTPKKIELDLDDSIDEVESLHVFCHGEEVRSTKNSEPYDPAERFAALRSRWKGIPAVALLKSERSTRLALSRDGTRLFVARKQDNGWKLFAFDAVHMRKICEAEVGTGDSYLDTPAWVGDETVAFASDEHLKLLTVATGKCEDVLDGVYFVRAAPEAGPDMVAVLGRKDWWRGSWQEKFNIRTRKESDFIDPQPGRVFFDSAGDIQFRMLVDQKSCSYFYRPTRDSGWRSFDDNVQDKGLKLNYTGRDILHKVANFECLSPDGKTAYLTVRQGSDYFELAAFNMKTGTVTKIFKRSPHYDFTTDAGVLNGALLFDAQSSGLLGMVYSTEKPQVVWFTSAYREIQKAIEKALPGKVCIPCDHSVDGKTLIYFAYSDRSPGGYYLFRPYEGTLAPLLEFGDEVDSKQTCAMQPFDFKSRDGALIHGYLTEPQDTGGKAPPLIVMIHGGPNLRDYWGFNPWVQFLASRGYAVLQVNFRGSSGFGQAYQLAGLEARLDTVVIDDIYDGVQAVLAEHKADPTRVGVMGGSFGGWATYLSLIRYPQLYRAGVAISAVSSWKSVKNDDTWWSYRQMLGAYGMSLFAKRGYSADAPFVDPLLRVGEIKRPIYVMHGAQDATVRCADAESMIKALKAAGADVRSKIFDRAGHSEWSFDDQVVMLNEVGSFFREKLAPLAEKPASTAATP